MFRRAQWLLLLLVTFAGIQATKPVRAEEGKRFVFPNDPAVLDARRDFGAMGDGETDDTAALQRALDASCGRDPAFRGKSNLLFIPNGVYRVTGTLVVKYSLGPWISGESRDGVIIRLDDHVKDVTCVLRTHPNESGPTSADWFMRNLRHFTIDVGDNPEVDGIRYYATNSGCLKDVKVIGRGKIGVNAGFLGQSGPNLIQDVTIEGFDTGILSQWIWSETISRVTIRNCRKVGLEVSANVVGVEDLVVENTPVAIENKVPNDWYHWGGVVALIGGKFTGTGAAEPAIRNHSILYARNVTTSGFARSLESKSPGGNVEDSNITEYLSHPHKELFAGSPATSLQLPIRAEPQVPWEHDISRWFCLDEHGAKANDNEDDTDAIEQALQQAAREGKTVVYFRGCGGPEPNWFRIRRPIRVPAPIRMVTGLGWGRILGFDDGGFVVDDNSAPLVRFQNLDSFGGPPIQLVNASSKSTLVAESCGVHFVGSGRGDIFVTDCPAKIDLRTAGQSCWARQLNPEGTSDTGLVRNRGAHLWCLGVKHEGRGVRFATHDAGKTEVLGLFNYGHYEETDLRPMFLTENAAFSVAGLREISFGHTARVKATETRRNESRTLGIASEPGWIGWSLYSGRSAE
jgi:hypothetical protein